MFTRHILCVRILSKKPNLLSSTNVNCHRTLYVGICRPHTRIVPFHSNKIRNNTFPILSSSFIRNINTDETTNVNSGTAENVNPEVLQKVEGIPIPELPSPHIADNHVETILSELAQHNLGGWMKPTGIVQEILFYMHETTGLPWWATIAAATMIIRTCLFPIVIKMQKNAAEMQKTMPGMQAIQAELLEARKMGDEMEVARLSNEYHIYMKTHNVKPMKAVLLPMIQAPIFLSFFFALRGMVGVPLESMKEGGIFWFTDLTVADPYYLLPAITSLTLYITMEMGAESMKLELMGPVVRWLFRAIPFVMFPFIIKFQSAILCYWAATNIFTLMQTCMLRIPTVRKKLNIPPLEKVDKKKLPMSNRGFKQGFKDTWNNAKVAKEIRSRQLADLDVFEEAGKGPVPKTYKTNPLLAKKMKQ